MTVFFKKQQHPVNTELDGAGTLVFSFYEPNPRSWYFPLREKENLSPPDRTRAHGTSLAPPLPATCSGSQAGAGLCLLLHKQARRRCRYVSVRHISVTMPAQTHDPREGGGYPALQRRFAHASAVGRPQCKRAGTSEAGPHRMAQCREGGNVEGGWQCAMRSRHSRHPVASHPHASFT